MRPPSPSFNNYYGLLVALVGCVAILIALLAPFDVVTRLTILGMSLIAVNFGGQHVMLQLVSDRMTQLEKTVITNKTQVTDLTQEVRFPGSKTDITP